MSPSLPNSNGAPRGALQCKQRFLQPKRTARLHITCSYSSLPRVQAPISSATLTPHINPQQPVNSIDRTLGFGFSAGGLLFPYYLGVVDALGTGGVLRPETPVAGASAGSLIAACSKSGLSVNHLAEALLDLAKDCRAGGTRHRLRGALDRVLQRTLPADVHVQCSGRVFIAVTRLWPKFQTEMVSVFHSRQHLIDTLLVSCHIPWYFDGSLFTRYNQSIYFDGGISNFVPATPTAEVVRVCCFPSRQLRAFGGIGISPDTFEPFPYDMKQMLGWAFEPADDEMLLAFIEKGRRDARSWLLARAGGLHDGGSVSSLASASMDGQGGGGGDGAREQSVVFAGAAAVRQAAAAKGGDGGSSERLLL